MLEFVTEIQIKIYEECMRRLTFSDEIFLSDDDKLYNEPELLHFSQTRIQKLNSFSLVYQCNIYNVE